MAEGDGLLNRYKTLKPYRGFESPSLRHFHYLAPVCARGPARETATDVPGFVPAFADAARWCEAPHRTA